MYKKGKVFIALTLVLAMLVSTCSAAAYTVQKGDSLWKLAAKYFGKGQEYTKIVEANPEIKDPNLIYVGQELIIPEEISEAIKSVTTEGFVDTDGAKASKIVVEYNVDLTGAEIGLDDYAVDNYAIANASKCEIGADPGKPTAVSVEGSKVIIDLNVDYQMGSVANPYGLAMYAGVKQVNDITLPDGSKILASETEVVNYTVVEKQGRNGVSYNNIANEGAYVIKGIEGYQIFTKEAGNAFRATNCFEEATGEYIDVDLPYALYVPEDYDASKQYAVVLHIHDAGFLGDDPMITLTEAQGPYNFASDEVQQILKDQGLGGLIVVAPQINNALRSTRDNWTTSAAVPATWQLMDTITETYNVDMNRIYATGQSMGAMQVLEMAAERDNYFAGILPIGCQWGTNYSKEADYQGAYYYTAPADGEIIWTVDSDGKPCDYRNWFYMISDDNILLLNCVGDTFSTGVWNELVWLYNDLADAQFPKLTWNPIELTQEEQNAKLQELLAMDSDLGFYWGAFEGGNHMATWIYGHGVTDAYDWLFTQTRESEMARAKLALDKPFEAADEQIQTAEREVKADSGVYFVTGKLGAGTADYNTTTYGKGGKLETYPNWKPVPSIVNVTTEGFVDTDGAKVSKIIVEYNADMTGADVSLDDYVVDNYGISQGDAKCEIGSDPGKPIAVTVDGAKVIIDLNVDYQLGSVAKSYALAMYAGVKQVNDITLADGTIAKAYANEFVNYTATEVKGFKGTSIYNYANEGAYVIKGIEGYQIFTREAGNAFHATNCFEEATGEYIDVDLPYALYVPEDYDASKQYAVVLHIHDAGFLGDDPMITLTEAQGPYNFASDEVQQILKDQGLGGLIVVAPQINNALRSTRDNWTTSAAVPATWQLMDTITETYNVDMNRIYATGQSMGAMQVLEMAAERDNYFAGILPIGCQWGTNYNKEADYQGAGYFTAPADGEIIWTVDSDGKPCDYRNWFYMISDDNILLLNCVGDTFSTGVWNELVWLYNDLADAQFPKLTWNPIELTQEEQNAKLQELLAMDSDLGFYWGAFEGGNHMATWIYGHGVTDAYDWLFTQTRESEMARAKLALDKPFEAADEQIQTAEREVKADSGVYFVTGKLGAGTADYNTTTYGKGGKLETYPNWKPAD